MPAHAGTWSLGFDAGSAQLGPQNGNETEFDGIVGLRVGYWITPNYAIEASVARADGHVDINGPGLVTRSVDRDLRSTRLGARAQWTIGERGFFFGRAGYDDSRISREEPVVSSVYDPASGRTITTVGFHNRSTDTGPYVGLGLGWRWGAHWSSSVDITRMYGDAAYGCDSISCGSTHASRLDSATIGIEYRFE